MTLIDEINSGEKGEGPIIDWLPSYLQKHGLSCLIQGKILMIFSDHKYSIPREPYNLLTNTLYTITDDNKLKLVSIAVPQVYRVEDHELLVEELTENLYDIYEIPFIATTCWLWFSEECEDWFLASRRSPNIMDVSWRKGREEFGFAFLKALPAAFEWSSLDKTMTYSFILHSHYINLYTPMGCEKRMLYFIGARKNEENSPVEFPDIVIPRQPIIYEDKISEDDVKNMYSRMANSLTSDDPCLGFICRSKCGQYHHLIESALHSFIVSAIGEIPDIRQIAFSALYRRDMEIERMKKLFPDIANKFDIALNTLKKLSIELAKDIPCDEILHEQLRTLVLSTIDISSLGEQEVREKAIYDIMRRADNIEMRQKVRKIVFDAMSK